MIETSQAQNEQKRLTKSASFSKQLDQAEQSQNEKHGGRLYQDSLNNKLDPFGDVNSFSYLPRNTYTYSGSMSLKSHIQKQNSKKLNNRSKLLGVDKISAPISERENDNLPSKPQKLSTSKRSSEKNSKGNVNNKCSDIPASLIIPPILYEESQMENPNDNKSNNKQEVYENDSELEMTLRHLTNAQLQKQYRSLVQRYISSSEQFQALMKKKEKATQHLEQLRKNVDELEAEQQIVEEEYERLGLGTPRSKENSDMNADSNASSILKTNDVNENDNNN